MPKGKCPNRVMPTLPSQGQVFLGKLRQGQMLEGGSETQKASLSYFTSYDRSELGRQGGRGSLGKARGRILACFG